MSILQKAKNSTKTSSKSLRPKPKDWHNEPVHFGLLFSVLIIMAYGLIMVTSASYYNSISNSSVSVGLLMSAGMWTILGLMAMFFFMKIDYRVLQKWHVVIIVLVFIGLLVLFTPLGVTVNGATRWIAVPGLSFLSIMPGEIAKLGVIIFTAAHISKRKVDLQDFKLDFLMLTVLMLAIILLVIKQPNLSTAITIAMIMVAIMFVSGISFYYFLCYIILGTVGVAGLIIAEPYRLSRMMSFMDPVGNRADEGFQVFQSLIAIGTGGLKGRGLGNSIQKSLYLPEPQNDFILAIIGEETGFIGIVLLFVLYVIIIAIGISIVIKVPDRFGMLLGSGIIMMIGVQLLLNVAVVTSSMPPTGVILPFVSYGGNATMVFSASIGILLNMSRRVKYKNRIDYEENFINMN